MNKPGLVEVSFWQDSCSVEYCALTKCNYLSSGNVLLSVVHFSEPLYDLAVSGEYLVHEWVLPLVTDLTDCVVGSGGQ